ncbi:hypothetical protein FBU59_005640 [Linderina macrospora]|uniref:Uncharacterized protein n=1 Tax=Linderina macrospora TaxID=4868 RepID=A0ACC1J283_9FUNG|nr:hypothetical protein FBU59_005640 [Linderina macrospora]
MLPINRLSRTTALGRRLYSQAKDGFSIKQRPLPTTTSVKYSIPQDPFLLAAKFREVARSGKLDDAVAIVMQTKTRDQSVVVWNLVINELAKGGRLGRALRAFTEMRKRGFKPTPTTFTALLKACSLSDSANRAQIAGELFDSMDRYKVEPSLINVNSLMMVYQRDEKIEPLLTCFNNLPTEGPLAPSLETYTTVVSTLRREFMKLLSGNQSTKTPGDASAFVDARRHALNKQNLYRSFEAIMDVWESLVEDTLARDTETLMVDAKLVNMVLKCCHSIYNENRSLGRRGLKVIEDVYGLEKDLSPGAQGAKSKAADTPLVELLSDQLARDDSELTVIDPSTVDLALTLCMRDGEVMKAIRFWRRLMSNHRGMVKPTKPNYALYLDLLHSRLEKFEVLK